MGIVEGIAGVEEAFGEDGAHQGVEVVIRLTQHSIPYLTLTGGFGDRGGRGGGDRGGRGRGAPRGGGRGRGAPRGGRGGAGAKGGAKTIIVSPVLKTFGCGLQIVLQP